MTRLPTERVLKDAARIVHVWQANPDFRLGTVTRADFEQAVAGLEAAQATVEARRAELVGLTDVRDDQARARSDLVTRARRGIRAVYGGERRAGSGEREAWSQLILPQVGMPALRGSGGASRSGAPTRSVGASRGAWA